MLRAKKGQQPILKKLTGLCPSWSYSITLGVHAVPSNTQRIHLQKPLSPVISAAHVCVCVGWGAYSILQTGGLGLNHANVKLKQYMCTKISIGGQTHCNRSIYISIYIYWKKNRTFCILLQKNRTFSHSFTFFAKERCVLCVFLHSFQKNFTFFSVL